MDIKKIGIILAAFLCLKQLFSTLTINEIYYFIYPVSKIISIITNSKFDFINDIGFHYENLNIIIDKSCSGTNFFLILFLALSFRVIKLKNYNAFHFFITLLVSYLLTIIANSSRISISIFLKNPSGAVLTSAPWMHQFQGTFIYLFFLIVFYISVDLSLNKLNK